MKKYYADIYHAPSGGRVTIGEYSEKAIEHSIHACMEQKHWKAEDCIWTVHAEDVPVKAETP